MAKSIANCLLVVSLAFFSFWRPAMAQESEPRLALVIGNAQYAQPLATAANDAGLVADSLRTAGFDVIGGADLDQDSLRHAFRDFLDKAAQAGPNAIAFVYLSGLGLQYEGENYFAPVGAVIARDSDIPLEAVRVSDFTRALAALPLRARVVVLDAARANDFAKGGQLAGGLALVDPDPGSLYAFNAAPGTIAPNEPGPYGAYARALAEMLSEDGASLDEMFSRVRLRVDATTRGAFTPWDASKIAPPVVLQEGGANAPAAAAEQSYEELQSRPIRSFSPEDAYAAALQRDTLQGYQEFLAIYPDNQLASRVRALLAARREALTWRRAVSADTPDAYWSYLRRYPHGPHEFDARRRLNLLTASIEPPRSFEVYDFGGLPPPPEAEYAIVDIPVIVFYLYPPPPPPPVYFLPPPPREFISLPPPQPPQHHGLLPLPVPILLRNERPNARRGAFTQPDFGQHGPVGAEPGAHNPAPGAPPVGAQPNHNFPQGQGAPPVTPAGRTNLGPGPARLPGAPAAPAIVNPTAQNPAVARPPVNGAEPGAHNPAPGAPPAGAQPNHNFPQGHGAPPVTPSVANPPAQNPGAARPPVNGVAEPNALQRRGPPAAAPAAPQAQPRAVAPQTARPVAPMAQPRAAAPPPQQFQQMRPAPQQQIRPQMQQPLPRPVPRQMQEMRRLPVAPRAAAAGQSRQEPRRPE